MVFSFTKGTSKWYYSYYGDHRKGNPNFRKFPDEAMQDFLQQQLQELFRVSGLGFDQPQVIQGFFLQQNYPKGSGLRL